MTFEDILFGIISFIFFSIGLMALVTGIKNNNFGLVIISSMGFIPSYIFGNMYSDHWFLYNFLIALVIFLITMAVITFREKYYYVPININFEEIQPTNNNSENNSYQHLPINV
jgi:hypothetical protein